MKRREPPRSSVHPCPAPRFNPYPPSKTIRAPSGLHTRGIPYGPVLRDRLPASVLIELVISRHVGADVLARPRIHVRLIALITPLVKAVRGRQAHGADLHWIRARQLQCLSAAHGLVEIISS